MKLCEKEVNTMKEEKKPVADFHAMGAFKKKFQKQKTRAFNTQPKQSDPGSSS